MSRSYTSQFVLIVTLGLVGAGCSSGGSGGGSYGAATPSPAPIASSSASAPGPVAMNPTQPTTSVDGAATSGSAGSSVSVGGETYTYDTPTTSTSPVPVTLARTVEAVVAPVTSLVNTRFDDGFTFATTRRVTLEVTAHGHDGRILSGTRITVLRADGSQVFAGRTDADGRLTATLSLPTADTYVRVRAAAVGIVNEHYVAVAQLDAVTVAFGAGA